MIRPYKLAEIADRDGDLSKEWYVHYSYLMPDSEDEFKRIRVKGGINRHHTKTERYEVARRLRASIDESLREGFNPFTDLTIQEKTSLGEEMKLSEAIKYYWDHHIADTGDRSRENYNWSMRMFQESMNETFGTDPSLSQIRKANIRDALAKLKQQRGWKSNRTRNNVRQSIYSLFNYLVNDEDVALKENPCRFVEELPEGESVQNKPATDAEFKRIVKHLYKHDKRLLLAQLFVLYCALRTSDLGKIKGDQLVMYKPKGMSRAVPAIKLFGHQVKNKKSRLQLMHPDLFKLMEELKMYEVPADWFLFGPQLLPAPVPWLSFRNRIGERWKEVVKEALQLDVGLYSNKAYQATYMAQHGTDDEDIQLWADHESVKTTRDSYIRGNVPLTTVGLLDDMVRMPKLK